MNRKQNNVSKKKVAGYEVSFPCAPGTTVYVIQDGRVKTTVIQRYYQALSGSWYAVARHYRDISVDEFGLSVFLTAEQAHEVNHVGFQ